MCTNVRRKSPGVIMQKGKAAALAFRQKKCLRSRGEQDVDSGADGRCEDLCILGGDDLRLNGDFLLSWIFGQFEWDGGEMLIKADQSVGTKLGPDVSLSRLGDLGRLISIQGSSLREIGQPGCVATAGRCSVA